MRGLIGAAVLAAAVGGAAAQEPVTYQQYPYKVGDKTRSTKTEETTNSTVITAMGQVQKKDERRKKTVVYVTEVLEVGPDATKPAKMRRTYEKAVEEADGVESSMSLDGLTVTAVRAGEKYAFTLAGGTPPAGKVAAALDADFNKKGTFNDNIFPKTPVKPGDSWDLTEQFLKDTADPTNPFVVDEKKVTVTGKLLSATKKAGATVGDVRVTADLPLTELRGKLPLKLNSGSGWKIEMTGSGTLDGSSPEGATTGTMKVSLDGAAMGVGVKIVTESRLSSRTERVTDAKR